MIAVVGLSHKTAPIEVREQAALSKEGIATVLAELVAAPVIGEAMIISTCNRVEIVCAGHGPCPAELDDVLREIERVLVGHVSGIEDHLYRHLGAGAIAHLFRVAASLDSLVLGEPQILGQVKGAFETALSLGTIGSRLRRVVGHAVRAAKRVRSETTVGAGQVSVPSVGVDLARQIFGELKGKRAALVGSGEMGGTAAKLLTASGVELFVVGRNSSRVAGFAAELGAQPRSMTELKETLSHVDMVISATSASEYVITPDMLKAVRRSRRGRNLFLIDLAVPRDVDPRVEALDSVFLYNVDDLSQIVAETLTSREREASVAERIVVQETELYDRALSAEQATPTIVALRSQFGAILHGELERSLKSKLKHLGAAEQKALGKMLDAGLGKLLHPAMCHLRGLASAEETQAELDAQVALLRDVFALTGAGDDRESESPASRRGSLVASVDSEPSPDVADASISESGKANTSDSAQKVS